VSRVQAKFRTSALIDDRLIAAFEKDPQQRLADGRNAQNASLPGRSNAPDTDPGWEHIRPSI